MELIKNLLLSMRPKQWIKNLIIFAALIFSLNIFVLEALTKAFVAFFIFCGISGAIYIVNDIVDKKADSKHQKKSKRPIASGKINVSTAWLFSIMIGVACLGVSLLLNKKFFLICIIYILIQLSYSFYLKHVVIVDVFLISFGFILRALAGAFAIKVTISDWFIICTLLVCIFIALTKRRSELLFLEEGNSRPVLKDYNFEFIDQAISIVCSATVLSYILYTVAPETVYKFKTTSLLYTTPFVLFGILRYLYLVYKQKIGEEPELLILGDKFLFFNILAYFLTVLFILYR
jgi:4-hydroxybenzoate polyprenyltransferase